MLLGFHVVNTMLLGSHVWIRLGADISRVEAIVRPAMDRKILGPFSPQKNFMRSPMNDSFKRGLRNALTGL
jgi:transcription initiation factor TFIIH subunit 4